jgi:hypothetical protein
MYFLAEKCLEKDIELAKIFENALILKTLHANLIENLK